MAEAKRRSKRGRLSVEPLERRELLAVDMFVTWRPTNPGPLEKGEMLVTNEEKLSVSFFTLDFAEKEITLTNFTHAGGSELAEYAFANETFKSITIDIPNSTSTGTPIGSKKAPHTPVYEQYGLGRATISSIDFSTSSEAREIESITFNYADLQVTTTKRLAASALVTPAKGWDGSR